MLRALLFLAGLALVVAGVALVYIPAAFVTGGVSLCAICALQESAATRREKHAEPKRGRR